MTSLKSWLLELEYEVLTGSTETEVSELIYDSRKAAPGKVFVCMTGARIDAHSFIPQVYEAGCRIFVVEKNLAALCEDEAFSAFFSAEGVKAAITLIYVEDTRHALALLSAARFGNPAKKLKLIGITGTKGKTTAAFMLKSVLERAGKRVGVIGTNGCEIAGVHYETRNTTPESYELNRYFLKMIEAGCEYVIMECSSQGFKMHRTDGLLFSYGVFLNISPDHIGPSEHADFEEYISCKARMFAQSECVILNADDAHFPETLLRASACAPERIVTCGIEADANLRAAGLRYTADSGFVGVEFDTGGLFEAHIRLSIPGDFNVANALPMLYIAETEGIDRKLTEAAFSEIHVDGRMEIVYKSDRFQVLIDYAHNAVSMVSLLNTLRSYRPKRLVLVFGSGGNRSMERRTGMGAAAAGAADYTILTADNSRFEKTEDIIADIREAYLAAGGSPEKLTEIPDRREAICYAVSHAEEGDMIAVIGKGHETYQEENGERRHFSDREEILKAVEQIKR